MKRLGCVVCMVALCLMSCGKEDAPKVGGSDDGQPNNVNDMGSEPADTGVDPGDGGPGDDAGPSDMEAVDTGSDIGGADMTGDMGMDVNVDMMVDPCGNGILDAMEQCDPGIAAGMMGACPTDCDDGLVCTTATLTGLAVDCTARCVPGAPVCANGDLCCAGAPCDSTNDSECFVPSGMSVSNHAITGPSNISIGEIELGPNGRKFVAGIFQGTVQLDATTTLTPVNSFGAAWVAELDANNDVTWVKTATSEMLTNVGAIAYDEVNDELAVAFGTLGETSLSLDGTTYPLDGLNDFAVAKFDAANGGAVEWVNLYANPERQIAYDIEVSPDGSIWVTGGFQGTLDFGNGPQTAADWDAFLVQLDTDGSSLNSWTFGAAMADFGRALAVFDDGSIAVFGGFVGMVDFGGGVRTSTGGGNSSYFGLRLDNAGAHMWSLAYEVIGGASDATVTANGNVAVVGRSRGNPDFGDGAQNGHGDNDIVVGILDSSTGIGVRTAVAGGSGNDYAIAVASTYAGLNIVGHTEGGMDFFGNAFTTPGTDGDGFVARLSPGAGSSWIRAFGGVGEEDVNSVAVDPNYGVHVIGSHRSAIDLGLGALPYDANGDAYYLVLAP